MPATQIEVKVPSAGESVTEVQVAAWNAAEGDRVERDQVIAELETDKATSEVTAPATGVLLKIVAEEGHRRGGRRHPRRYRGGRGRRR